MRGGIIQRGGPAYVPLNVNGSDSEAEREGNRNREGRAAAAAGDQADIEMGSALDSFRQGLKTGDLVDVLDLQLNQWRLCEITNEMNGQVNVRHADRPAAVGIWIDKSSQRIAKPFTRSQQSLPSDASGVVASTGAEPIFDDEASTNMASASASVLVVQPSAPLASMVAVSPPSSAPLSPPPYSPTAGVSPTQTQAQSQSQSTRVPANARILSMHPAKAGGPSEKWLRDKKKEAERKMIRGINSRISAQMAEQTAYTRQQEQREGEPEGEQGEEGEQQQQQQPGTGSGTGTGTQ